MEKEIKIIVPEGYKIDKENSTFECIKFKPIEQKFVYVDLGLPSGTLWATWNIGAKNESDFGDYLTFDEACKYELPKKWQFDELIEECTCGWDKLNGTLGYYFIGPNGNYIFLPAAGSSYACAGSCGNYWSRTISSSNPNNAWRLGFISTDVYVNDGIRYHGRSVRPILNRKQ